jgi:hypothetical protein
MVLLVLLVMRSVVQATMVLSEDLYTGLPI